MSLNQQNSRQPRSLVMPVLLTLMSTCLLSLAMWLYAPHAEAQRVGPFMLVAHSNQTANVGIFRLDTSSGAVSFCTPDPSGTTVRCSAAAQ